MAVCSGVRPCALARCGLAVGRAGTGVGTGTERAAALAVAESEAGEVTVAGAAAGAAGAVVAAGDKGLVDGAKPPVDAASSAPCPNGLSFASSPNSARTISV
jgi:hypothetical protein